ncbi:hypothetical protein RND81_01G119600 [Saponaria officinalis]|uniref:Uncharacterized protein n=1 Tax=Saponaria officinalis TaxID=3572 RepID=A0AAW1NEX8_SAPOF
MAVATHQDQVSLITCRLQQCRYDDSTLRLLQLMISSSSSSKDVQLSVNLRRNLIHLVTSHSLTALRNAASQPIQLKLLTLDFFLRAFSILHHLQSCLSLRYEALLLRHSSVVAHPELQVSYHEWLAFAQLAFAHAFYSVAVKACDHALLCLNRQGDASRENFSEITSVNTIQRLKDAAIILSSNHSVQAHAAEYSKKKNLIQKKTSFSTEIECPASISFKNGIKLHNARNFMRLKNQ